MDIDPILKALKDYVDLLEEASKLDQQRRIIYEKITELERDKNALAEHISSMVKTPTVFRLEDKVVGVNGGDIIVFVDYFL